jgi:hypothetical protein
MPSWKPARAESLGLISNYRYQQGFRFPEFYPDFLYEELGSERKGGGR